MWRLLWMPLKEQSHSAVQYTHKIISIQWETNWQMEIVPSDKKGRLTILWFCDDY